MRCGRTELDSIRYIDNEMTQEERAEYEEHLLSCDECRRTVERFKELKALTGRVRMKDPTDEFWEDYWKSLYRRMERRVAWIFIIIGAVIFFAYALYEIFISFREFTLDKAGIAFVLAGIILLLISVIRERVHGYRVDRYRDIQR